MFDLKLTPNGELVIGEDGDLEVVYGDDYIAQEIIFRLKTQLGDFILAPEKGADLERYIGEPNTPLTHAAIENSVAGCLSYDNFLLDPDVTAVFIGENKVMIVVEFTSFEARDRIIQVTSNLDLREGLVFARVNSRVIN